MFPPFPPLVERVYLSRYFGNKGGSQLYICIHTGTDFVSRCVQWCKRIDRFQLVDCAMHSRISPHGRRVNLFYSPVTFRCSNHFSMYCVFCHSKCHIYLSRAKANERYIRIREKLCEPNARVNLCLAYFRYVIIFKFAEGAFINQSRR